MIISQLDSIAYKEATICVNLKDNRSWSTCLYDMACGLFKEVLSRHERQYNPLKDRASALFPKPQMGLGQRYGYDVSSLDCFRSEKKVLIVFLHGLNSSPLCFSKYIQRIENNKDIGFFAPHILNKGYCTLQEAADPVLRKMEHFVRRFPKTKIVLIGFSNGARIAAYVERHLAAKKIHLISVAGPHYGSKLISWLNFFGMTKLLRLTDEMTEELLYHDRDANLEMEKWVQSDTINIETIHGKKVTRDFFATADDLRVFPYETSFPALSNSRYHLVAGETHVTIIDAIEDLVFERLAL